MKSVIICDMEGLILKMNNQAEKIFGYNSKELINIKRVSIFSPGEIVLQNVLGWLKIANEKKISIITLNALALIYKLNILYIKNRFIFVMNHSNEPLINCKNI